MRIVDIIANKILESLEESPYMSLFEIKREKYLEVECEIADLIGKELLYQIKRYLNYDIDLGEFQDDEF